MGVPLALPFGGSSDDRVSARFPNVATNDPAEYSDDRDLPQAEDVDDKDLPQEEDMDDEDAPLDEDVDEEDEALGEMVCPSCRGIVTEDTQKCPHCGDWITPEHASSHGWRRWVFVGAVLLMLWALLRWMGVL